MWLCITKLTKWSLHDLFLLLKQAPIFPLFFFSRAVCEIGFKPGVWEFLHKCSFIPLLSSNTCQKSSHIADQANHCQTNSSRVFSIPTLDYWMQCFLLTKAAEVTVWAKVGWNMSEPIDTKAHQQCKINVRRRSQTFFTAGIKSRK